MVSFSFLSKGGGCLPLASALPFCHPGGA